MKRTFLVVILLQLSFTATALDRESERKELQILLKQREDRFGDYSRAAASRSGFFGNKTKNDLKSQLEVLTDIVRNDNKIISTLDNYLDYRTFTQTELTYTQADLDEKNQRLDELTTTLSKKLASAEAEKKQMSIRARWLKVWNYLLLFTTMLFGFLWFRVKRVKTV